MATLLILIIGISGYLFVQRHPLSRFKQSKFTGWDAYFHVGSWGVLFSIASAVVVAMVAWFIDLAGYGPYVLAKDASPLAVNALNPMHLALFYWSVLSCLLGVVVGKVSNSEKNIRLAVAHIAVNDELETLLITSLNERKPIQVSMGNRKIYVGYALNQITCDDFSRQEYISMLPLLSGYRDKDTLSPDFVSDYEEFYKVGSSVDQLAFRVILPISDIASAAFFDKNAHAEISKKGAKKADADTEEQLAL